MKLKLIGRVRSPFKRIRDVPRDYGSTVGEIEVFKEYGPGLKDIDGIFHFIVLWLFHKSKGYYLHVKPLHHEGVRGVFATRHRNRPNPIGFTVVELLERTGNMLKVKGVDMVDGTPVLDMKPYTSADQKGSIRVGWIEKKKTGIPRKVKTLIVYWSGTGNTEKVAKAIHRGLKRSGLEPTIKMVKEAREEELYDYDLVFLGAPSHTWMPAQPVLKFIKEKRKEYSKRGLIKPCAPKFPGKSAVVFCTYSGPHTGINEAIPAGKYMRQFFEHLGFDVRAEWYVVGEFHGNELLSTKGKLGDIRGRPNSEDLAKVETDTVQLIQSLM